MFKLMYLIFLASFITIFLTLCCTSFTCVHDRIVERPRRLFTRSTGYKDIKVQRDKDSVIYEPLSIHFYFDTLDRTISPNAVDSIEIALRKVRKYILNTFKVQKRTRPFLLERQSCSQKWQDGRNVGKCSKFSKEPEVCISQEMRYQIPDRYLKKLVIYEYDSEKPQIKFPAGSGLVDSNFITFIVSQEASMCEELGVSAFGTYCRLDPETNEPLAAILHLCPSYFSRKLYTPQHYYNIFLHEIFHVLGFSIHLFEKFIPCHKGIYCDFPKNAIQTDGDGIARLMFPLVVKNMQTHFSCSNPDFGGPMVSEVTNITDEAEDETKHYTSHWDPLLMYSSVMMPEFSEYDHIFVDNITLAVFGSTGWYEINYTKADDFQFGRGEGCKFGIGGSCNSSTYLCDPKAEDKLGCDLMHESVGKCTAISSQLQCGVYQTFNKESCDAIVGNEHGLDYHTFGYKHKCFMMFDKGNDTRPSCLPFKCKSSGDYKVFFNMIWYDCYSKQMLQTANYSIYCPESSLFCPAALSLYFMWPRNEFYIAVRMNFHKPTFADLDKNKSIRNFKVSIIRGLAEKMNIPVNYIINVSLSVFKKVQLDFSIFPPFSKEDSVGKQSELNKVIRNVQSFLDGESFMYIFKEPDNIAATKEIKIDPRNAVSFSDHEGFRTLLLFPAVCGIFMLATFVASLVRLVLNRKR